MPLLRGPALLERVWRWVDRLDPGDAVTREDLDATADDLADAITEAYRAARRRAIPAAELPVTGEPFEQIVTLQPDDTLQLREWRITGWYTTRIMRPDGGTTVIDEGASPAADTTPPPKPLGWAAVSTLDGVLFQGIPSPATDFRAFRLWEAEVGQPPSIATLVDERAALQILRAGMQPGTVRRFWISAVDQSGNDSEKSDYMDAGPAPTISDFAQRITELEATSDLAEARLSLVETAYVDADEALASRVQTIEATYVDAGALESEVTSVASALIGVEQIARAGADEALASRLETIEAEYVTTFDLGPAITAEVTAQVSSEATARATADEALATRLDAIEADYQTSGEVSSAISAAISTEQTARAGADGALAARLDTIEADYETTAGAQAKVNAKAVEITTAYAAADTALSSRIDTVEADYTFIIGSIDALEGNFGDITAAINAAVSSEATARANADGALSSRVGAIEASYVTSGAMTTAINAKANEITLAYAAADQALASRATALESAVNHPSTGLAATGARVTTAEQAVATEATARANADSTLRAEVLRVASRAESVISDPLFRTYPAATTTGWVGYSTSDSPGATTVQVQPGGQIIQQVVSSASDNLGLAIFSNGAEWPGVKNPSGWAVEIDAEVIGSESGAGFGIWWLDSTTTRDSVQARVPFSAMRRDGVAGGLARYSIALPFTPPAGFTFSHHVLYLFANYTAFSGVGGWPVSPAAAKTVRWHQVNLRPATAEELGSGRVGAAITTAVSAETSARQTAIANEASARTQAINAAKSEITGGSARTIAQVDADQQTKVTQSQAESAANSRISAALQVGGSITTAISGQVQQEANARANADSALASQLNTLTANYNGTAATVTTQASAIAGLEAREAAYRIQANAGVPGGLEIVSTANGSKARLWANEIMLDGSVFINNLAADAVSRVLFAQGGPITLQSYEIGVLGMAFWRLGRQKVIIYPNVKAYPPANPRSYSLAVFMKIYARINGGAWWVVEEFTSYTVFWDAAIFPITAILPEAWLDHTLELQINMRVAVDGDASLTGAKMYVMVVN